ncbi:Amidase family protein isoform 3 [Hibiscus syriacus]|uniref:Amidase family protein isoform 3 n=1 Tax=Hibiscus syriacus TaxID=106335 RepID=A0A6A2ZXK5_HIBSY|nr:probable amidase At4g34880 [Hibiscus syriacus]KAE8696157.1 Amidase family protein isoform 3 [Hibiscus syriacus]
MASTKSSPLSFPLFLAFMFLFLQPHVSSFSIKEATVQDLQLAFRRKQLTSRQLVEFYIGEIHRLNPLLKAVVEVNPDARSQADKADRERKAKAAGSLGVLHGIPVLLKDNIATKDRMNTTAGSLALLRSVVPRDAGVVSKLRKAGAIILGKASLSEWAHFRGYSAPSGWCARTGQGKNPYNISQDPCGSSSGSAIAVASNLAAVTLGTETDGSILCPSNNNAVVGIKPTVGLTSRAGVIPITPRQDTVGPMCRTVTDAVYVLDAIAGSDSNDNATVEASKYIPRGGYKQFLKMDGLRGKRLGLFRNEFFNFGNGPVYAKAFERHFTILRKRGAVLVENVNASKYLGAYNTDTDYENLAMTAEFKLAINSYLKELVASPVRSLRDLIAFNNKFAKLEKTKEYGQEYFLDAEATNGIGKKEKAAILKLAKMSRYGFKKLMKENKLDALLSPFSLASPMLATGQHPGIIVPAGYGSDGVPFGLCFGGLKGSEPTLIEIAYGFEQATKIRRPPSINH